MGLTGILLRGFGAASSSAINSPTLAVVDNANGTATATVGNSTTGATNTVYVRSVVDWTTAGSWTSAGSRTGNGTVSLTLAAGYYWAYVESVLSGQEASGVPVGFRVTDGSLAVFRQCLDGVLARLQGMTFTGITSSNIEIRKLPWNRNNTKPGMFIVPVPERQDPTAGDNLRELIGYGIAVAVARTSNGALTDNLSAELLWRQQINKAFRNQKLDDVVENCKCDVEPGSVINASMFDKGYDVFSLTIRCWCHETRGLS